LFGILRTVESAIVVMILPLNRQKVVLSINDNILPCKRERICCALY
jgi:hypothetical protein